MGCRDRVQKGRDEQPVMLQGFRDQLSERTLQPLLEPGEQIQAAFRAQTGPNPWWTEGFLSPVMNLGLLIVRSISKHYVVVVTGRNVVLFKTHNPAALRTASPELVFFARLPREPLGVPKGRKWGKVMIGGKRYWVGRAFFNTVAAASATLAANENAN